MKKNHALAALATLVLGGVLWIAIASLSAEERAAPTLVARPAPAATDMGEPRALKHSAASESRTPAQPARQAVAPTVEAQADAWEGELGGLIGRVVEEDETPVEGISVALVQADANLMLAADWTALGEPLPKLVLDTTQTDAEGRFHLDGAYDASFQGLGIDLRGPRATLRVVDTQLHHGEVTDVGDIVLRGGCTIFGRVVDEAGQPIPGARVRIVPKPPNVDLTMFLQVGVQDFRADCSVGISKLVVEEAPSPLVELPPIVRQHIDDLPIPTTWTDANGEYRIEGAPIGELIQGADKPGWVGVSRVVTTTAGEVELEPAVLTAGRTIQGVVIDEKGEPQAGVEVLAGSELVFGEAAILRPAGVTGPDGRFALRGCPETGGVMAVARRSPDEPWMGALEPAGRELEIELESTIALTVHVVDEAGEAVSGAGVKLSPGAGQDSPMAAIGLFMDLGAEPRDARLVETEPGTYVCAEVTPGPYEVEARPRELGMARKHVELWQGNAELTLVCPAGEMVEVTVVDAATGAGIAGARASILGAGFPFLSALAVGRTGPEGRVRLGPFSSRTDEDSPLPFPTDVGLQVLVQHPRYADRSITLVEGAPTVHVEMLRGGEIHGRITWGPDPPQSVYMVILENTDRGNDIMEAFLPPRLGKSDLSGAFRFTNLPPGTFRIAVFDRFLDRDPIQLILAQEEPTMVHREDGVQLEPAGRTDVLIDLSPSGRGKTARLAGSVYVDLQPIAGAQIQVWGGGPGVSTETDDRGNFETPDFLAMDEVHVRISGDVETPSGVLEDVSLYSDSLSPTPHSVHRLDLDLRSHPVQVKVTGPSGAPIAQARIRASSPKGWGGGPGATTDELGQAELTLIGLGEHTLSISADGYANGAAHVDSNAADFDGEVAVELRGAAPCAGVVDLNDFGVTDRRQSAYLQITGPGHGDWLNLEPDDLSDDGRAAFRAKGLQPGTYEAQVWYEARQSETISFELPEGGDENLVLVFRPREGDR